MERRRLAFPYRQNVSLPACHLRIGNIVPGLLLLLISNEITTANPWARRSSSSLSVGFAQANMRSGWIHQSFKLPLSSIYLTVVLLKSDLVVDVDCRPEYNKKS